MDPTLSEHVEQHPQLSCQVALRPSELDQANTLAAESMAFDSNVDLGFDSQFHGGFRMFFDSSSDMQGLSEDLDWLFGTLPSEQDEAYGFCGGTGDAANLPSFSPSSTHSYQSLTEVANASDSVWLDVREKIMLALQPVPPTLLESSFFDPVNLDRFYHIYFTNYNSHFPIVHQPTFSCRDASPLLLLAILSLGATLSDREHFQTAQALHDRLRWLIFSVSTSHAANSGISTDLDSRARFNHRHPSGACKPCSLYKRSARCFQRASTMKWPTFSMAQSSR